MDGEFRCLCRRNSVEYFILLPSSCSGVHYYWNVADDTVSWLPPDHPNAAISRCAAILRKELEPLQSEIEDKGENVQEEMVYDMQNVGSIRFSLFQHDLMTYEMIVNSGAVD